MNVKLDSLIEKIKADGVEAAKKQADKIITDTEKEAEEIIKKAEAEAEKYRKKAESDANSYQKNAETAIQQAGRDTLLVLKEKITKMFEQVLLSDIDAKLEKDFLKELIVQFAKTWAKDEDIKILLNEVDSDDLSAQLKKSLSAQIKGDIEIKVDRKIEHGFRIGKKDGNVFYDFTDESILDALRVFLNPKLAELLK
jgi:V/A-type H+/Na+-transporting ATPase subunit E